MNIDAFIESIRSEVSFKDLLVCGERKDLMVNGQYDAVVLDQLLERVPVFSADSIWQKVKKLLRPGGIIILNTLIYKNPNQLGGDEKSYSSIRCNKQSMATLLRSCLEQNLLIIKSKESCFGLIRKSDLPIYDTEKQKDFLSCHLKLLRNYDLENKDAYSTTDLRKIVSGAGRLAIGCVAENNKKYQTQALRLVQSIRWFGGETAGANIFVCMVDEADPEFVKKLEKWGVFVRIVKRFSASHPPSNKLRFFELPEIASYDTIMLLDCDTVIVQDPYTYIDGGHFQAEIAAAATVSPLLFRQIFKHYRLPLPKQTFITPISRENTIWYCNAGVLIFPKEILEQFYPVWKKYTISLSENKQLLGDHYFFCEQASLTLAYASHPVPFKKLPMSMNFHLISNRSYHIKNCDPVIIHYHSMSDQAGFLKNISPYRFVKRRVNQFNNRLRKVYSESK